MPGAELDHDHDLDPNSARTPECPGTLKNRPQPGGQKKTQKSPPKGDPSKEPISSENGSGASLIKG